MFGSNVPIRVGDFCPPYVRLCDVILLIRWIINYKFEIVNSIVYLWTNETATSRYFYARVIVVSQAERNAENSLAIFSIGPEDLEVGAGEMRLILNTTWISTVTFENERIKIKYCPGTHASFMSRRQTADVAAIYYVKCIFAIVLSAEKQADWNVPFYGFTREISPQGAQRACSFNLFTLDNDRNATFAAIISGIDCW